MIMKKIIWITGACFTETDYNYDVMYELAKKFEIHWFILGAIKNYLPEKAFDIFKNIPNLNVYWRNNKYRIRDPRGLIFYLKLLKEINSKHPDVIYCNASPEPPFAIMSIFLNKKKTIFAAHDGKVQNDSSSFSLIRTFGYNTIFKHSRYVNMFSKSQAELMNETYPQNKIHTMVLPLKDFGKSTKSLPNNYIRFLSFGSIIYQKNIDLLIEAGELLYNKGYRNFKISINGGCKNWEFYQKKIKHPEVFECNPQFISNETLLDLFATSHYAVFPYRRVSQSGVLKLAFNYNVPVIASQIGSFKEEIIEGLNGFFFEAGNVTSLANVMETCINRKKSDFNLLKSKMDTFIKEKYSIKNITSYYTELFTTFIQ